MSQESKDRLAETVVKKAVRKLFGKTVIDKIAVGPSENHYGEPSLFVTIYVKPAQKRISASQLVDTIAAAETALREIGDYRIPFVTFIAPEDEPAESPRTAA